MLAPGSATWTRRKQVLEYERMSAAKAVRTKPPSTCVGVRFQLGGSFGGVMANAGR
jgi:hypothetical protein